MSCGIKIYSSTTVSQSVSKLDVLFFLDVWMNPVLRIRIRSYSELLRLGGSGSVNHSGSTTLEESSETSESSP